MTPSAMSDNRMVLVQAFKNATENPSLQDTWMSDVGLLEVLLYNYGLAGFIHEDELSALQQMNRAVAQAHEFSTIDIAFLANSTGYFRMQMKVKAKGR